MDPEKSAIATLLRWILGELSLLGRLAAFFGTVLVLWGIASPRPTTLLAGIGLVFLALCDGYWQKRYSLIYRRYLALYPYEEKPRWCERFVWSRVFLALVFFAAFMVMAYFWLRLPAVSEFLRSAGISF